MTKMYGAWAAESRGQTAVADKADYGRRDHDPDWRFALQHALDSGLDDFYRAPDVNSIDRLAWQLGKIHDLALAEDQLPEFRTICQSHLLAQIILEDPYSRRAYEKPRGYAGDAVMLDYIYRPSLIGMSETGQVVHRATTELPNAKSVLWRRDYLTRHILAIAKRTNAGRVLSVASGHMRELDEIAGTGDERNLEFHAVDSDRASLDECKRSYPSFNLNVIASPAIAISRLKLNGGFHLIYAAGLSDYLSDATLEFLIAQLYKRLLPNGLLCLSNFTRQNHGRGFMEGFMNWSLVLRNEFELLGAARSALPGCRASVFTDPFGNIAYLEIRKQPEH